ncbi:MAG: urease accessory protein UreE [Magnetococcus sp. WYHC-3]
MRTAHAVLPSGSWDPSRECACVTLTHAHRHRRRIRLLDDRGEPFLLDLLQAALLADGDGLELAQGGVIRVRAAPEAVAEVHPRDMVQAARLAWHLGNRHAPVQILPQGWLRLADDAVLVALLQGLGAVVMRTEAPFSPESGAYSGAHVPGGTHAPEDHAHSHGHEHEHEHEHGHGHEYHPDTTSR